MAEIDITLTVHCGECSKDIDADWDWRKHELTVTPCPHCTEKAVKEAQEELNSTIAELRDSINDLNRELNQ